LYFISQTPLHFACKHGAFKCIDYLLATDAGHADVNAFKYVDFLAAPHRAHLTFIKTGFIAVDAPGVDDRHERSTPLMLGMKHGSRLVAKLLESGASVSFQTRLKRQSMLHIAILVQMREMGDLPEVVRWLISAGVPINERDVKNSTALNLLLQQVISYALQVLFEITGSL